MDMLSRVADSLYWMSRYLERAENIARLLDVHIGLALEQTQKHSATRWKRVASSLGMNIKEPAQQSITNALCFDFSNHSSIVACIMSARDNARQVREQISSEMWEQLNRLSYEVRRAGVNEAWDHPEQDLLREVREGGQMFHGITDSTMNHGEGWQFIQLGRFMERANATAKLLDVHFRDLLPEGVTSIEVEDQNEWIGLLKSCTAFETYCKVYTAEMRPERVAEFLMLNQEFPHSIRFAVDKIQTAMDTLPAKGQRKNSIKPVRLAGKLRAALGFSQMDEIMANGLHPFLEDLERQCMQVHNAIHQVYIEYPVENAIES